MDLRERLGIAIAGEGRGSHAEVLSHGQGPEQLASFGDLHDAAPHDLVRLQAGDGFALELDGACGPRHQSGDRVQRGRLPRAVGTDERHDLALIDLQ